MNNDYLEFSVSQNLVEFIGYQNFAELILTEYNKKQQSNYAILNWTYNHETLLFKIKLKKMPIIAEMPLYTIFNGTPCEM